MWFTNLKIKYSPCNKYFGEISALGDHTAASVFYEHSGEGHPCITLLSYGTNVTIYLS